MQAHQSIRRPAVSRVRGLAHAGAGRAAAAFGVLVGQELRAREPRVCQGSGAAAAGDAETGVIFEMAGSVNGLVALLLSRAGCEWFLDCLCLDDEEASHSALRELGNIVASQAVSGVADQLRGRVTLSVPTLVNEHAGRVLDRLLAKRGDARSVVTTTEIRDSAGALRGLLVFAPDAP